MSYSMCYIPGCLDIYDLLEGIRMMDLSLVPQVDLVNEIKRRYDSIVIGGFNNKTKDAGERHIEWYGDVAHAFLLCESLKHDILKYIDADARESDE